MHDASAKFSSGILTGNYNRYGSFDQCLEIISPKKLVRGKYCLASLKFQIMDRNQHLKYLNRLALSYEPFKGGFNDVSIHITMRFTSNPL